jgi:amidase
MKTIVVLACVSLLVGVLLMRGQGKDAARQKFTVVDATVSQMRTALQQGRVSSRELVTQYLTRIALYDSVLHAVMTVNPQALNEADERDRERARGQLRGPLHGIPIALKDNIMTSDLPTTGGALVFDGFVPPYEATLTKNLRDAGAIIIVKTRLNEFAGWVAAAPTPFPGNYNALRRFGMNPYDPRPDPRPAAGHDGRPALNPRGSSYGGGTASSLWAADVGTDTTGSLLGPSNVTMLVGLRPTLARISRYGVIPVTADQDMPGPMARTVTDAAIMLGVLEGARPDPNDAATSTCAPPPGRDYTPFLNAKALKGARIGIPRAFFYDPVVPPGATKPRGGLGQAEKQLMEEAISVLKQQGAGIVDPADFPSVTTHARTGNYPAFPICGDADQGRGKDTNCSIVLKYGAKRDLNKWLGTLGPAAPVKTLTELRQWNLNHVAAGAIRFGMGRLDISDEVNLEEDRARYEADRARDLAMSRTNGFDAVMNANRLDAVMFPGSSGSDIADRAGYPTIALPFGTIPNSPTPPFPEGFEAKPGPYGVTFTGSSCSEPRLIGIAYAFEQATKRRVPPQSTP